MNADRRRFATDENSSSVHLRASARICGSPSFRSLCPPCLCGVLLLALLIRGGVLLLTPGALETDPDGYRRLAENLVEHGTFGTECRSPLPLGEGKGEGVSATAENEERRTKNEELPLRPSALTLTLSQRERGLVPTAYRPPLYPLLLTGCVALGDYSRAAVAVLHLVMGVATVGLVLVLGRWWGLGNRGAALAALWSPATPSC